MKFSFLVGCFGVESGFVIQDLISPNIQKIRFYRKLVISEKGCRISNFCKREVSLISLKAGS